MNTKNDNAPSHVEILGLGKSRDRRHFVEIRVKLMGQSTTRLIAIDDLEQCPNAALNGLGLFRPSDRNALLKRVTEEYQHPRKTFRVWSMPGWYDKRAFVLPSGEVFGARVGTRVHVPRETLDAKPRFCSSGSLKAWKRIPELASGNPWMMMSLALAFAGPVALLLDVEVVMVQIFGPAGAGKSSVGAAVASVWGPRAETWNNTANNFERVARAHHATFMVVDETHLADFDTVKSTIMRVQEGRSRGRLTDSSAGADFQLSVLSLSNLSLDKMAALARVQIDDSLRTRMIDVPTPTGSTGAFSNLHRFDGHDALSSELRRIACENHGVASVEFLEQLTQRLVFEKDEMIKMLNSWRQRYIDVARNRIPDDGRDLARLHQKFATIYAAGRLARLFGILPWKANELGNAVIACERAHVAHVRARAGAANEMVVSSIDSVKRLGEFSRVHKAEFVDLRDGLPAATVRRASLAPLGYINCGPDGTCELLFTFASLSQIAGAGREELIADLKTNGALKTGHHGSVMRRSISEDKRAYVYVVRARKLMQFGRGRSEE